MIFFFTLENDINMYENVGKVFVVGDMNSRTGKKVDYVENDGILGRDGVTDIDLPLSRASQDCKSNRFGEYLLDLCKATGIRIVNGRLFDDQGKITCMTYNGQSVVDYVLTHYQNFETLNKFAVHDFNEYSNHAPVSFCVRTNGTQTNVANDVKTSYRWNSAHKDEFRN